MIEFIEDTHQYLIDGILVPSVTQIVRKSFKEDFYANVPSYILEAKAEYGNKIHAAVEEILTGSGKSIKLSTMQNISVDCAIEKMKECGLIGGKYKSEKLVSYKHLYAGTYDLYNTDMNVLIDIKTTAKYNKEYLEKQLGMYRVAMKKSSAKCYCLWMPKKDAVRVIPVEPIKKEEVLDMVDAYNADRAEDCGWIV